MKTKFIAASLFALSCFGSVSAFAREEKPLDAFISNVKESYTFVTVGNLWQPNNLLDQKELLKNVAKAQPLTIDYTQVDLFLKKKTTAINLVIPGLNGTTHTIELARYDFLTNDFEVHGMGANGEDTKVDYTPGLYYSGIVKGIPGSLASFSFFKNEVYGMFSIPGEGNYVLAPNTMVGESYNSNPNYILYNDDDILFKDMAPKCVSDMLPRMLDDNKGHKTTTTANNNVFNSCTEVKCFETADSNMYVKKGNSVINCTNYLTALFNGKYTIYKNEGIPITLKYIQVNTATDPYRSLSTTASNASGLWLTKFGQITQNTMHGCDVATLFTTKGGGMGGVAWLGTMCSNYGPSQSSGPYAFCNINNSATLTTTPFPTYSWEVEVSTHEMGHNLGSPHTHACVWGPARNYAIDSCYTIEGSCIAPAGRPTSAVKGTIMSYCHLLSIGINFANGFGQQPGDTIRFAVNDVFSSTCGVTYHPGMALATANKTISANRECTDMNTGTTYYWNDHLTAGYDDDTLVLMIKKNGNNIGTLNSTGFSVKQVTAATYGSNTGQATTFPTGTAGVAAGNTSMRRYWSMTPTTQPTTAVEVIFPFTKTDSADVDGSITGAAIPMTSLKMYKVNNPIDPNPANAFATATAANFSVYTYAATASTTNWSLTRSGDTCFAHMMMTKLSGGGTGFYPSGPVTGVGSVNNGSATINIYPNPTNDKWFVAISGTNAAEMSMNLYAADGKLVHTQLLQTGVVNSISAANLPVGVYYYRVIGSDNTYTGSLLKR